MGNQIKGSKLEPKLITPSINICNNESDNPFDTHEDAFSTEDTLKSPKIEKPKDLAVSLYNDLPSNPLSPTTLETEDISKIIFKDSLFKLERRLMLLYNKNTCIFKSCYPYAVIANIGVIPLFNKLIENYIKSMYTIENKSIPVCVRYPECIVSWVKSYNVTVLNPEKAFNVLFIADKLSDLIIYLSSKPNCTVMSINIVKLIVNTVDTILNRIENTSGVISYSKAINIVLDGVNEYSNNIYN